MRLAVLVACLVLAGCMSDHGEFYATPCKPAGEAVHGTLRVQIEPGAEAAGTCVALEQFDRVRATARIGADGNATLNLPVDGGVRIEWTRPYAHDKACASHASIVITVPGPTNVTLRTNGICY